MESKKAFTLIELLVVIAIIALLLAVIAPALEKAKRQARFAVCQSNLHQYGIAMASYISDTEMFPHPAYWLHLERIDLPWNPGCSWHIEEYYPDGLLWPYFDEEKVHLCPTWYRYAKDKICLYGHEPDHYPVNPKYNYGMNGYLGFSGGPFPWTPNEFFPELWVGGVLKPGEVRGPSNTIVFMEENPWPIPGLSVDFMFDNCTFPRGPSPDATPPYTQDDYPRTNQIGCVATYHKPPAGDLNEGVGNVVMMDGHVQQVDAWDRDGDITFDLCWPK
jgi:prepilin-type N-terminal cleavage/methylation domain-containing protein/prepilin-type processing-associated H-X9-DG protein